MRFAGIGGIILLAISFIYLVLTSIDYLGTISLVNSMRDLVGGGNFPSFSPGEGGGGFLSGVAFFVFLGALFFFYLGFTKMGFYTKNNLLRVSSWILFGLVGILILFSFFIEGFSEFVVSSFGVTVFYFFVGLVVLSLVSSVLFFVSLIKIRRKIKFTFSSGVLGLITTFFQVCLLSFFTYLFFLLRSGVLTDSFGAILSFELFLFSIPGFLIFVFLSLVYLVTYLFLVFSLFEGSRKYEKNRKSLGFFS